MRCFLGRVYDGERGAWVACERCSGTGRVVVYLYPQAQVPSRVARFVLLFGPESHCRGSGSLLLGVGHKNGGRLFECASVHAPSKNPRPVSQVQAYRFTSWQVNSANFVLKLSENLTSEPI